METTVRRCRLFVSPPFINSAVDVGLNIITKYNR